MIAGRVSLPGPEPAYRVGARCGGRLAPCGREIVGVRTVLEWAFGSECAQLERDDIDAAPAQTLSSTGAVMDMLKLGFEPGVGVRVDRTRGRSLPHHDADLVADAVRASVRWSLAVQVAEHARAASAPRWDLGPVRCVPCAWTMRGPGAGRLGKSHVAERIRYQSRRGWITRDVLVTPVTYAPTVSQVAAARRGYLDWWGALRSVLGHLRHVDLDAFVLSDALPPRRPWLNRG